MAKPCLVSIRPSTALFAQECILASPNYCATNDVVQGPVWLAAYTTPRHEKSVVRHLEVREVEYFLPLYKVERKWKNGCKVQVEFPIFPNYVFVHVNRRMSHRVLDAPGVLAFAGSGRHPVSVPDSEIDWLRNELPLRKFEPHPYLVIGSRVRIKSGPLAGMNGVLTRKKSGLRVVLSIDLIRQSVAVEVGMDEIERSA
jgi:transcription antitermination factor NusG